MIQEEEECGGKGKKENLGPKSTECITNIPLRFRPPEPSWTLNNVGQNIVPFSFAPDSVGMQPYNYRARQPTIVALIRQMH